MKKIIAMLVLVLGITFTIQAQKERKNGKEDLTVEQKTTLKVKKMILNLDLTDSQVKEITPLVKKQVEMHKEMRQKRKALKDSDKKMSADERFAMANKNLDRKIAVKKEMKRILNEEQYKKYERMAKHKIGKRVKKGEKGMKKVAGNKALCEQKNK